MAYTYKKRVATDEENKAWEIAHQYDNYDENSIESIVNWQNQLNQNNALKPQDWTGGKFGATMNDIVNQLNNREKFTYDLNADALYQQYKDQYITQGRLAMQDTMGQAAAMTGGYGNSYASTAGNQAYQGYLQQLNDVVPQLYAMAMDKYKMEGDALKDQYSVTADMYNREYGEHRDSVSDWQYQNEYLTNQLNNERNFQWGMHTDNRDFYYGNANTITDRNINQHNTEQDQGFRAYQQSVAEEQAAQQLALEQAALEIQRQKAASSGNSGNGGKAVTPTQTQNATKLKSYLKTRSEWSRGSDASYYTNKGKKYEDYVEDVINQWYQDGKIDDGEALWLFNTYNIK